MNIEELIDKLAKEIETDFSNKCRLDIKRRMKQVVRHVAQNCADMIQDAKTYLTADELFSGKHTTTKEFADKMSNRILNEFLS